MVYCYYVDNYYVTGDIKLPIERVFMQYYSDYIKVVENTVEKTIRIFMKDKEIRIPDSSVEPKSLDRLKLFEAFLSKVEDGSTIMFPSLFTLSEDILEAESRYLTLLSSDVYAEFFEAPTLNTKSVKWIGSQLDPSVFQSYIIHAFQKMFELEQLHNGGMDAKTSKDNPTQMANEAKKTNL